MCPPTSSPYLYVLLLNHSQVHYEAAGFLEKNRDSLPTGAVELFQASSNDLIHDIFMGKRCCWLHVITVRF